jgi:hypothetical protein
MGEDLDMKAKEKRGKYAVHGPNPRSANHQQHYSVLHSLSFSFTHWHCALTCGVHYPHVHNHNNLPQKTGQSNHFQSPQEPSQIINCLFKDLQKLNRYKCIVAVEDGEDKLTSQLDILCLFLIKVGFSK